MCFKRLYTLEYICKYYFLKKNVNVIFNILFKNFSQEKIIHFPFFQSWAEVWINKDIVNWHKEGQSIDRFLTKYQGHEPIKYRLWEAKKKKMSYITVNFPTGYIEGGEVFLKDILSEKDGVKFSLTFMKRILDTQIEKF